MWVLAAIVLFGAEMFTTDLVVGSVGAGCLFAAGAAGLGASLIGQLAAFSAGTVILMLAVRPRLKALLYRPADGRKSGVAALIGEEAAVVDPIARGAAGRVRIGGEVWRAVSEDAPLGAGETVVVEAVESATLRVRGGRKPGEG